MARTAVKQKDAIENGVVAGPINSPVEIIPASPAQSPSPIRDGLVRPIVSAEEAKRLWDEYNETCRAILNENDYIYYACGKKADGYECKPIACRTRSLAEEQIAKFQKANYSDCHVKETKKRSAWDKLSRFYGISTPIESEALCAVAEVQQVGEYLVEKLLGDSFKIFIYQDSATLTVKKVSVLLRIVSPNGRTILGDGACSTSERSKGADSFAHADHDVFSTAFTRAMNRGISRCIGTGEVSAEEFDSVTPQEQAASVESAPVQQIPKEAPKQAENPMQAPAVQTPAVQPPQNVQAQETAPVGPPKAEIPTELPGHTKQQSFSTAAQAPPPESQSPNLASSYTPLSDDAKLSDRILSIQKFVFGSERPNHHLVKYLLFAISPTPKASYEVETNGRFSGEKWNAALKSLGDERFVRGKIVEVELAKMGRDVFLKWAQATVEAARAKKLFA